MPELPEVETVVQGLRKPMIGAYVQTLILNRPDLRWPIPHQVMAMEGQKIVDVHRVAKTIVVVGELGNGWLMHLGMSGRITILSPPYPQIEKHDHIQIMLGQGLDQVPATQLRFNDPRRFGAFDFFANRDELPRHPRLRHFGIDPTTQALSAQWLYDLSRSRKVSLKTLLLDQRLIAGLGNIYVSEALFRARLHPVMAASTLGRHDCDALVASIKETLAEAIAAGGSSLRDFVQASGELGYFQHQWRVYGRASKPCVSCNRSIERIVQQGRSTFLCPQCQPYRQP